MVSQRVFRNNDFYNKFNQEEKTKIITITNKNSDNSWFKTKGGNNTTDNIFLLSLEEVCEYFGNSKEKLQNKNNQAWLIDDENNSN